MKINITFDLDVDHHSIQNYNDGYLVALWHIAQANPSDGMKNREPGEFAEMVGREIIRRFIVNVGPELWNHQGSHFNWAQWALERPSREAA